MRIPDCPVGWSGLWIGYSFMMVSIEGNTFIMLVIIAHLEINSFTKKHWKVLYPIVYKNIPLS